jgi:transposase
MTFFDKKLVGFFSREKKHTRWSKSGVWQHIFEALAANADNEYAMIDSTIVRAHQHSAGAKKRGPKSRQSGAAVAG